MISRSSKRSIFGTATFFSEKKVRARSEGKKAIRRGNKFLKMLAPSEVVNHDQGSLKYKGIEKNWSSS